jgi:hypothetical protein
MSPGFERVWEVRLARTRTARQTMRRYFTSSGTALDEGNRLDFAAAFESINRNSERYGTYPLCLPVLIIEPIEANEVGYNPHGYAEPYLAQRSTFG